MASQKPNISKTATRTGHRHRGKKIWVVEQYAKLPVEEVITSLSSSRQGLSTEEVYRRQQRFGTNEVMHQRAPSVLRQLLQAFNNPFIYILLALAFVTFCTDYLLPALDHEDTDLTGVLIISTMIGLSGGLRFWQEFRTNRAAMALKSMVRTTATVLRQGPGTFAQVREEVAISELVPGDVIVLSAGDLIPADIRLLESRDLFVSQAILTGESLPVEKFDVMGDVAQKCSEATVTPLSQPSLLEMGNICLMGTNVASGTATGMVVAIGGETYFGSLAKSIVGTRSQTAFDRGVNSVSWLLIRFMLVMVPVVMVINGLTKGDWVEASLFALAVAVGLTPEMLPMIVSSNLAKGAIAMSRRKVIVKRLNAIQNFGAMDVLCTDKTGTLTQDRIILENHYDCHGNDSPGVLFLAWLNSFHQSGTRNLMDKAILHFAEEVISPGMRGKFSKVDELPFDFVRRRVSVLLQNKRQGGYHLICKGAVEEMLSVATHIRGENEREPLTTAARARIEEMARRFNQQGYRVLLVATRFFSPEAPHDTLRPDDEQGLVIEGVLTFLDPPKESAEKAVRALEAHGVAVKVLTGDNLVVAACICQSVGIRTASALTGPQLEMMDDGELATAVETCSLFARLTPMQKSRVLTVLQKNGHTVGFLGDGINDAPALQDADVGISVDSAADIAKETSDIILLEKDLLVLEEGVIKGRETFGNIIKYLNMTASSNFGNVFSVLVASAFIPFLPMLALHLLIQNLMYDLSQLSLPWDRMDREFLRTPRKWDARNIGRFMVWVGPTSSIFDMTTYALMWFVFGANNVAVQSLFQSGWFIEGLLSQTLVVHMLRTQKIPFFQSCAALPVLLTTGLIMAAGIYIPFSPLGPLIGLVPLPLSYFPWLLVTLFCYCLVAQGMKTFYIKRYGQWF
jgi:Mg2+-importing ATPase